MATYNQVGSGGVYGNGTAINTAKFAAYIPSGGVYGNGTAVVAKKYASYVASGGLYANGHTTTIYPTYVASGGLYANGHTTTIYPTYVASGGLYANGNVAGVGAGDITLEYDTIYLPARPTIVFQVALFNNQTLNAYPQPDSLSNLALLQNAATINIPGVSTPLQNGTQFTLNGSLALQVKNAYSSVLSVVSIS